MYTKNPSFTIPKPCEHLSNFKHKNGLNCYTHLQNYLNFTPNGTNEIPRCDFCFGYKGSLYICLICSKISCLRQDSNHTDFHSETNNGHEIALDLKTVELYCCVCCDQVYDLDFDIAFMSQNFNELKKLIDCNSGGDSRNVKKVYSVESDLMKAKQSIILRRDSMSKMVYPMGLRGLNNLGNTCFMNSVLQALLHAPPLRNYFLSDNCHRKFCRKRSVDQLCLPCDINALFSTIFSGDHAPYSPAQFLYSWWFHSKTHATYEQQDAHEFYISILDQIHKKESKNLNLTGDVRDCKCIAHKVFSGLLRSDLSCTVCGSTSTTYDPCMDTSLDLYGQTNQLSDNINMATLSSCLRRFTRSENLGCNQKLYCENCQERQESSKQISFSKLPLVLCLHIKRFEHSHVKKMSRKIDEYLQYPFSLDMAPYISPTIVRARHGNRMFTFEDEDGNLVTEYDIFAVVTHSGMLDSGHYYTFLRLHNKWYKCDDAWIIEVDEAVVRSSQCYMIFYIQKMLHHKIIDDLSCSPNSPKRDTYLPIAGCC